MEQLRKETLQMQINEAMENEAFCVELLKCADAQAVCSLLAAYHITATEEEINRLKADGDASLKHYAAHGQDELSADELEDVTGGGRARRILRGAVSIVGGAALGFGLGCVCGVVPAFTPVAYKIGVGYGVVTAAWTISG